MKLYHYAHCPFCIRLRMAFKFLQIPYESILLDYDDEKTPLKLTNKKMLPIVEMQNEYFNESLDIIKLIDKDNQLNTLAVLQNENLETMNEILNDISIEVHNLAMPHWIYTKEFTKTARDYFQSKKEIKRGPFEKLVAQKELFIENLNKKLSIIELDLQPYYKSNNFSLNDIMLASHLWGLYIVPEFQFSSKFHNYLMNIKKITHFNYQEDLWKIQ